MTETDFSITEDERHVLALTRAAAAARQADELIIALNDIASEAKVAGRVGHLRDVSTARMLGQHVAPKTANNYRFNREQAVQKLGDLIERVDVLANRLDDARQLVTSTMPPPEPETAAAEEVAE